MPSLRNLNGAPEATAFATATVIATATEAITALALDMLKKG